MAYSPAGSARGGGGGADSGGGAGCGCCCVLMAMPKIGIRMLKMSGQRRESSD